MLTRIDIQNYKSIYKASVQLSPFTLLIGANGTGKSNFLQLLKQLSENQRSDKEEKLHLPRHHSFAAEDQRITVYNDNNQIYEVDESAQNIQVADQQVSVLSRSLPELSDVKIFSLIPQNAGKDETLALSPSVGEDGSGTVQVLDALKTGDREDLFDKIEAVFKDYIPEVKKLSFVPTQNAKRLQIRDKNLPKPVLVSELSEGMQLALILITILYQEKKPSLICIEDIDRGLHPRLYQQIVELCFDIAEREGVQIIATTHNPYLVDEFKDNEEAVLIVEKKDGQTKFTTLAERTEKIEPVEEPLGALWYAGFVGGVPQRA